jgi:fatty acid desaturase
MWAALGTGYWVGLLLAVPAAGFLVRLFMIQHDCGHGYSSADVARMTGLDALLAC